MIPSRFSTAFVLHPAAALHDPGLGHPEHQGRLRALAGAVAADMPALHDRVTGIETRSATDEELIRVHMPHYLSRLRDLADRAMEEERSIPLDSDTLVSAASWDAASGSAGAVLSAVEAIVQGQVRNAFVATRPPGHHALRDRAMGFCLLNHVAVAARFVQDRGWGKSVFILDWDVHHGNGTQEIFYDDPDVFYLSIHQFPHYPGTGSAAERGRGLGKGFTLNVPLSPGTPRELYRENFLRALEQVREVFRPDFVFVSSGFDVLAGDPLGDQRVEPRDLYEFTREVMAWADEACGGRVVVLLEGGYVAHRVGEGSVAVIRALAGLDPPPMSSLHGIR